MGSPRSAACSQSVPPYDVAHLSMMLKNSSMVVGALPTHSFNQAAPKPHQ